MSDSEKEAVFSENDARCLGVICFAILVVAGIIILSMWRKIESQQTEIQRLSETLSDQTQRLEKRPRCLRKAPRNSRSKIQSRQIGRMKLRYGFWRRFGLRLLLISNRRKLRLRRPQTHGLPV